jgi:nucleoside-diphosphate-sugar epimerase
MRIAILGATSQIAQDFVQTATSTDSHTYSLYARRPNAVKHWTDQCSLGNIASIAGFESFDNKQPFDAIINFVGIGNPAAAASMGSSIIDITHEFDTLALNYLKKNPGTRYIFLSSGAAYGSDFSQAATASTLSRFNVNHLQAEDWYGVAKFHAECRHRALSTFSIVDIRIFSYFSFSQDPSASFLISDVLRSIKSGHIFSTTAENIVRDYLGPHDFNQMIQKILLSAPTNTVVDCYTQQPVEKFDLLDVLKERYGLAYRISSPEVGTNVKVSRQKYYSTNHCANKMFGYFPALSAVEVILSESDKFLSM